MLDLKNPICAAPFPFSTLQGLEKSGALFTKSITLESRPGNAEPTILYMDWKLNCGDMINKNGLRNGGVHHFINEEFTRLWDLRVPIYASIAADSIEEFVKIVKILKDSNIAISGIELNISCPNVVYHSQYTYEFIRDVTSSCKNAAPEYPIIVKLPPIIDFIENFALACHDGGADAITATNTLKGMVFKNNKAFYGGLSGPQLKPIALRCVSEISKAIKNIPIIGVGGISNYDDALEFMSAGASAIMIGTAQFIDPATIPRIVDQFEKSS